ncbi:hypothetical protein Mpet_2320 [Methanolacinia petrolearia DSM 11571]|uniref:Uncharacterized protein n=1 Tax=Methanolacinia petrolearia (strain DSM 11571 / OCM 486 / SEBR 4847) TaxID=679926 RepID=E1RD84_METP4|nr:hypothetical protein [Methanolacinia petrolearia]ADN37067.1 hypothetical protein Mpet_2320 [Methanolacinia petrolearia DSM 11571]
MSECKTCDEILKQAGTTEDKSTWLTPERIEFIKGVLLGIALYFLYLYVKKKRH